MNYDSSIYIYWSNACNSNDFFELRLFNDYTTSHFLFEMGENSVNQNSRKITTNNPYLFIRNYANVNGVRDSYRPMPSYDISNIYFHWDIMESYNYVCEIEEIMTNNKSATVLMKEYLLNDMKVFRLNDGNQHCKFWFTNKGMKIIPVWYKRLLVEYVMFY
jgi:hypothetical protein